MTANNGMGSSLAKTTSIELLLNYCRTVVRSDDHLLRIAMDEYAQSLSTQQRR